MRTAGYTDIDVEVLDIDWLGVNASGQLALFTTGAIPSLPECLRACRAVIEDNADTVARLPELHGVQRVASLEKQHRKVMDVERYFSAYEPTARRGLFAFDATHFDPLIGTEYQCVVAPAEACLQLANVPELDPRGCVRFADIRFNLGQRLVVRSADSRTLK